MPIRKIVQPPVPIFHKTNSPSSNLVANGNDDASRTNDSCSVSSSESNDASSIKLSGSKKTVNNMFWHDLTEADRDTVLRTRGKGEDESISPDHKPIGVRFGSYMIEQEFLDLQIREKELQSKRPTAESVCLGNGLGIDGAQSSNHSNNGLYPHDCSPIDRRSSYSFYEKAAIQNSATDAQLAASFNSSDSSGSTNRSNGGGSQFNSKNTIGYQFPKSTNHMIEVGGRYNQSAKFSGFELSPTNRVADNFDSSSIDEIVEAERPDYLEKITKEMEDAARREEELRQRRKSCLQLNEPIKTTQRQETQFTEQPSTILRASHSSTTVSGSLNTPLAEYKSYNSLATVANNNVFSSFAANNRHTSPSNSIRVAPNGQTAMVANDDGNSVSTTTVFTTESPIQREIRIVAARELDLKNTKLEIEKELAASLRDVPAKTSTNFRHTSLTRNDKTYVTGPSTNHQQYSDLKKKSTPELYESLNDEKLLLSESKIEAEMRELLKREAELRSERNY